MEESNEPTSKDQQQQQPAAQQELAGDVKSLLNRLAPEEEKPAETSSWGWGGWGLPSVNSFTTSIGLPSVDSFTKTLSNAFESTLVEAEKASNMFLDDLSKVAHAVESALGLEEERKGFDAYFIEHGGKDLSQDLRELSNRAGEILSQVALTEQALDNLRQKLQSYRSSDEDDKSEAGEVTIGEGLDASALLEAVRKYRVELVDAHKKLQADLKEFREKNKDKKNTKEGGEKGEEEEEESHDEKVARMCVEGKVKMQSLYIAALMEVVSKAFLLIGHAGDFLLERNKGVSSAVEGNTDGLSSAEADSNKAAEEVKKLSELRKFLRKQVWRFESDYGEVVRSLPDLMEPFSESKELVEAMETLTQATQTEIVIDTESACQILDRHGFELLDNVVLLLALQKQ